MMSCYYKKKKFPRFLFFYGEIFFILEILCTFKQKKTEIGKDYWEVNVVFQDFYEHSGLDIFFLYLCEINEHVNFARFNLENILYVIITALINCYLLFLWYLFLFLFLLWKYNCILSLYQFSCGQDLIDDFFWVQVGE